MVLALKRSAYSTNIKTRSDFSCAFFDAELRSVAQAFTQPVHLGSMVQQVPHAVRRYGARTSARATRSSRTTRIPSGVHLNDVSLISPVLRRRRARRLRRQPRASRRRRRRRARVDRRVPRGVPGGRDHPAGQGRRGRDASSTTSSALILAQIRSKHETAGDFRAQIAANATGVRRLEALVDRHGRATLARDDGGAARVHRAARAGRDRAALPHGTYEAEGSVDNDGYTDEPVRLRARVEITPGRASHFDTTGLAIRSGGRRSTRRTRRPSRPAPTRSSA